MNMRLFSKVSFAIITILSLTVLLSMATLAEDNVNWKSNTKLDDGIKPSGINNTVTDWESRTYEAPAEETDNTSGTTGGGTMLPILAGLAGLLGITVIAGSALSKKEITSIIPEGNGLWVPEADRESVIGLINKAASKEYRIDEKGFVKPASEAEEDSSKSGTYSKILDTLIAGDKKVVIGVDGGWMSYNSEDDSVRRKDFTESDTGIAIGDNGTDQVIVVNGQDAKDGTAEIVLAHELIHALRGEYGLREIDTDGGVNQDEEANTILLENKIREELGIDNRTEEGLDEADTDWLSRLERSMREASGTVENHYAGGYNDYINGYEAYSNYEDVSYPDYQQYDAYGNYSDYSVYSVSYQDYGVYYNYSDHQDYSQYSEITLPPYLEYNEYTVPIPPTPPSLGSISISTPGSAKKGDTVTISASCTNADHLWMTVRDPNGTVVANFGNGKGESISTSITAAVEGTYSVTVEARNTPDEFVFGTQYTSASSTFSVVAPPPPPYNAEIVSSTIPSQMEAGKTYRVSVTVKNTGANAWTAANGYKLGGVGDSDPFASARQTLSSSETIATGQTKTFTFNMTAPSTPGTYTTDWRMLREGVNWFGGTLTKSVSVVPLTSLKLGDTGPSVTALKQNLIKLGYTLNGTDVFDAQTEAAVKMFQTLRGLTANGIVEANTSSAINNAVNNRNAGCLSRGMIGSDVNQLQTNLNKLGYSLGIDSQFGIKTEDAVKSFQTAHGFTANGIVTPTIMSEINKAIQRLEKIQEIKQNLYSLNPNEFKNIFNDYESAITEFLNNYYDGTQLLLDLYNSIQDKDDKLDALLSWSREALRQDGSITYGPGDLLPGEVYLQDIVNQTPGASLIGINTVSYCGVQSTFPGRLLKGKWVIKKQEFLNWKTEVYMSDVAARAFDHQIEVIDAEQGYTERNNWRYEVDMRERIVSDQSLQEARNILIGISFDVITAGGKTAAEAIVKQLVKSISKNALILLGHETEAAAFDVPTDWRGTATWTISSILEYLDISGIINADEVKSLSIAMAKQRVTETLVLGYLAARLKRDIFVERLTSLRDFTLTQLTREDINSNPNNIYITEDEFPVFVKYLVKNYDYVIQMNQEGSWNELSRELYEEVFPVIDELFV